MELKINFDTEKQGELTFVSALGVALSFASRSLAEDKDENGETEPKEEKATEPTPEPEPTPVEEAPKKRRRKKKEEPKEEPRQEVLPLDDASDLPFDNEPEPEPESVPESETETTPEQEPEPTPEPEPKKTASFPTATKDDFVKLNHVKREELGIVTEGKYGNLIREFNDYCKRSSMMAYGTDKPSSLPPEQLWQYCEWFKTIEMNPDYVSGSTDENKCYPFVSASLSKEK